MISHSLRAWLDRRKQTYGQDISDLPDQDARAKRKRSSDTTRKSTRAKPLYCYFFSFFLFYLSRDGKRTWPEQYNCTNKTRLPTSTIDPVKNGYSKRRNL